MSTNIGVVMFPGSNCDYDALEAVQAFGATAHILWHNTEDLSNIDAVILPGGFSYGDYLRPGALARFSAIIGQVKKFAALGGPVVGICNGFQVLTEAGLLPGVLQKNKGLKFICDNIKVKVEADSVLTHDAQRGSILEIPISHFEGNFTCDYATLEELESQDRIILRYEDNPNGSMGDIAGICNKQRNVVGLMPHPERAYNSIIGSGDGEILIKSLLNSASIFSDSK